MSGGIHLEVLWGKKMKKIPTLFEREFKDHKVVKVLPKVHPGMEWVLKWEGVATVKYDGSCCAIIDGEYYKRYDCKKDKIPPEGFIPCCEPDSITGHWPGWVKVDENNPSDKWFAEAYYVTSMWTNMKQLVDAFKIIHTISHPIN